MVQVVEAGIDHRAVWNAVGRMYRHTSWLIDHRQIFILIQDGKRQILRYSVRHFRLRQPEDVGLAFLHFPTGLIHHNAVGCNAALGQQLRDLGARKGCKLTQCRI